jgi:hypothetical protein
LQRHPLLCGGKKDYFYVYGNERSECVKKNKEKKRKE